MAKKPPRIPGQLELFPPEPEPPETLGGGYLLWVELVRDSIPEEVMGLKYPFDIPALLEIEKIEFHPAVTFLIGENGSGKSTFLEGMARKLGFSPEGGSLNYTFSTKDTHSCLHEHLRIARPANIRPQDHFFLRAESFYPLLTQVEAYEEDAPEPYREWGGRPPHTRSHGEAFLTLLTQRLRGHGLYLFDEPEAALSPQRQLAVLAHLHALVKTKSQLIIATHSPILLAYPHAKILEFSEDGLNEVAYADTELYQVTHGFLRRYETMVPQLLAEAEEELRDQR